jgi:Zn-dependent M32 family carboxypeptidase
MSDVIYDGYILAKNSVAYELWQEAKKSNDWKKLKQHMKELDQKNKDLVARYTK